MNSLIIGSPYCLAITVLENGMVGYDNENRIIDLLARLCLIFKLYGKDEIQ